MPPVGFEPTISAGERPKTYALDRAAQTEIKITNLAYAYIHFKARIPRLGISFVVIFQGQFCVYWF